jgi:multidrug efflux system membrane fusion protein
VVLVPTPAVLSGAPGDYVYLVNANKTVSVRKVTLGASDGRNTAILSGLAAGDSVVVDGTDRLSDGVAISVSAATSRATGTQQVPATPGSPPGSKARKKPSAPQGASAAS